MWIGSQCSSSQIRAIPLHTKRAQRARSAFPSALPFQSVHSQPRLLMSTWNNTKTQCKINPAVYFVELKEQRTEERP